MKDKKFNLNLIKPNKRNIREPHERLIHITKRLDVSTKYRVIIRVISIIVALLICALILNLFSPGSFGNFFFESFSAFLGSKTRFLNTMYEFALLLGISVALLPAFKMKFWNLGGEGQILIGGLAAALISHYVGPIVPPFICVILMIVAALAAGALWAFISAIFKAKFDTNETLFTLMMNYIAMGFIVFFAFIVNPSHGMFSDLTDGTFQFSNAAFDVIIPLIIVVVMTVFMFLYINKTKHGYELSVVGETRNTAKYIGINVKKVIIRTAVLSGLLCGIVGYFCVAKQKSISETIMNGRGFTAVMIVWLGHMNVLEIVLMSFLVAFITRGSSQVATMLDLGNSFTQISIAAFLIVILAFEFFLNYEIHINKNVLKKDKKSKKKEVL